jgi:hypothetical protein
MLASRASGNRSPMVVSRPSHHSFSESSVAEMMRGVGLEPTTPTQRLARSLLRQPHKRQIKLYPEKDQVRSEKQAARRARWEVLQPSGRRA